MAGPDQRPLLFLDVDGPLIPFGGGGYPTYGTVAAGANPLLSRVDPGLGPRLAALPCELVWATTWMEDANESVAPRLGLGRLGLGRLAVVAWPEPSEVDELDERAGLHWKTRALVSWAAGRPFAWVDDELTDVDRAWVAVNHPSRALLHRVDPRLGLTDADFGVLGGWLGSSSKT